MTKFYAYFSLGMGVFFVLAAILVALHPPKIFAEPPHARYLAAFIIFGYAVFRLMRAGKSMKAMNSTKNDPEA
ncbi:MAG: hypothetical protein H6581_06630 [Bacteroidia bacterium]|nr:hypothetical protein [Bacteroidia bacterium]